MRFSLSLLVLPLALLTACSKPAAPAFDPSAITWPVKVADVSAATVEDSSEFVATVRSRNSVTLQPQVEGQITHLFVKSGERVRIGEGILQIDPIKQQATVGIEEATRKSKQANLALARVQLNRVQQLSAAGVVPQQDLDTAQSAFDAAQADLTALDAQVKEQLVQLKYYNLVSPIDGFVGDVPVHEGDRVTTGTVLTTIDGVGGLEAYIDIPIEKAPQLKIGMPVELLDEQGAVAVRTQLTFISPQADASTQSVLAKAAIPAGKMRPSQFLRVRIIWNSHSGMLIPVTAVTRVGAQYFAYLVEGSGPSVKAQQRALRLGPIVKDNYVVLEGLKPGDKLIVSGTQNLTDGAKIVVTP